jgi:hypothetical protein
MPACCTTALWAIGKAKRTLSPEEKLWLPPSLIPPSGARCRRETMQYVVANQLVTSGVLTFTPDRIEQLVDGTIKIMHQFSLLMRSIRRIVQGEFPYVAVPEFSRGGRHHIHFMLPAEFPYDIVEEKWSKNGIAKHRMITNNGQLSKMGFYLGKYFDKPESERPTKRRVVKADGFKPKPEPARIMTYSEIEQMAYQNAQKLGTTVKVIKSSKPWLAGGFEWLS